MTITESRIKSLEDRLDELTKNFLQTQINQVPITQKVDETSNKVVELTPYTETKTAYIDDTEIVFEDIPKGSYTVTFDNPVKASEVMRENFTDNTSTITVKFEPLEEVTEVTLTIH